MGFLRVVIGFIAAVLALAVLGVIAQSGFVLAALGDIGADIGIGAALGMIVDDLLGFGPVYGGLIAVGLLIALPSAALVHRFSRLNRTLVFAIAGATCMLVMLLAIENFLFGVQLVAGARTAAGFVAQMLAGAAAGWIFTRLTPAPAR